VSCHPVSPPHTSIRQVWRGARGRDGALTHVPLIARPNLLDVGAGNGLLPSMVEAGYDPSRLTGIDYSQFSVDLCTAIAKRRNGAEDEEKHACENATFAVCDFLDPESPVPPPSKESTSDGVWDLVLDKGTLDAISLMDRDEQGVAPLERYVPRVVRLLRPGGYFLITCERLSSASFHKFTPTHSV